MAGHDLSAALAALQQRWQNFALFRGEDGDDLLVTPQAPSPSALAAVRERTGEGRIILQGVCARGSQGLVFATSTAAPIWQKMLEKMLRDRKCEGHLPLTLRALQPGEPTVATGQETLAGSSTAPTASATTSGPSAGGAAGSATEWEAVKGYLLPRLRERMTDPGAREKMTKVVQIAQASEKAGKFAEATIVFQRLAGVLQIELPSFAPAVAVGNELTAPAAVSSEAASIAAPTAPTFPAPELGQLQAALNNLAEPIEQTIARDPARRTEVLDLLSQCQQQIEAGEGAAARSALRRLAEALQGSRS